MPQQVFIEIVYPNRPAESRRLGPGTYIIGRDGGDIALSDRQVSGRHGELRIDDRDVVYTDLGSTNGSYTHQGARIDQPLHMREGDVVQVGACGITVRAIERWAPRRKPVKPVTPTMVIATGVPLPTGLNQTMGGLPSATPEPPATAGPQTAPARAATPIARPWPYGNPLGFGSGPTTAITDAPLGGSTRGSQHPWRRSQGPAALPGGSPFPLAAAPTQTTAHGAAPPPPLRSPSPIAATARAVNPPAPAHVRSPFDATAHGATPPPGVGPKAPFGTVSTEPGSAPQSPNPHDEPIVTTGEAQAERVETPAVPAAAPFRGPEDGPAAATPPGSEGPQATADSPGSEGPQATADPPGSEGPQQATADPPRTDAAAGRGQTDRGMQDFPREFGRRLNEMHRILRPHWRVLAEVVAAVALPLGALQILLGFVPVLGFLLSGFVGVVELCLLLLVVQGVLAQYLWRVCQGHSPTILEARAAHRAEQGAWLRTIAIGTMVSGLGACLILPALPLGWAIVPAYLIDHKRDLDVNRRSVELFLADWRHLLQAMAILWTPVFGFSITLAVLGSVPGIVRLTPLILAAGLCVGFPYWTLCSLLLYQEAKARVEG